MKDSLAYLEPWICVVDEAELFTLELKREISPQHPLFEIKAHAIARRIDCDDVLFEIESNETQLAVVHLTWSGKREDEPIWPSTKFYRDSEEWINSCMMIDHLDYSGAE
jgi:hypothetical protein